VQDFQHLAWECTTKKALLHGIRHFLSDSLVLPAGDWDEELLKPIIHVARKKAAEVRRKSLHPMALKSKHGIQQYCFRTLVWENGVLGRSMFLEIRVFWEGCSMFLIA
jgi:hypothetical protein